MSQDTARKHAKAVSVYYRKLATGAYQNDTLSAYSYCVKFFAADMLAK